MEKKTLEENMSLYNQVRCVPKDAISPITGGPMKGKSNINPQWRLETLTRLFGPIGVGFRIEQVSRWTESTADGEVAVFCEVNLYVKNGDEWSAPIFGQGGSMLVRRSTDFVHGEPVTTLHLDDEGYKKAYTDAISVAAKALGVGADIYWKTETTKYPTATEKSESRSDSATDSATATPTASTPSRKTLKPGKPGWKETIAWLSDLRKDPQTVKANYNITEEDFNALCKAAGRQS